MVSPGQLLRKQSTHVPKAASPKISQVRPRVRHSQVSRSPVSSRALFGGLFGGSKIDDSQFYICVDCGYIYDLREPFSQVPNSYKCPVCAAPKRKFKAYQGDFRGRPPNDNRSMNARLKERNWR